MHTEFKHMFIYIYIYIFIYVCASMHVCIVRIYVQMSVSMRKHVYIPEGPKALTIKVLRCKAMLKIIYSINPP